MSMGADATVYIVDDDEGSRELLKHLLMSVGLNVHVFSSARSFLDVYSGEGPGCLLLDIRMPGMSGLELQQVLRSRMYNLPIVIVTGYGDAQVAVQAMKNGAFDFIEKPIRNQAMLEIVAKALEESRKAVGEQHRLTEIRKRLARLTKREWEVLHQVRSGNFNKEIAFNLGLSERTVEVHRARLMKKMVARSVADLLMMVSAASTGDSRNSISANPNIDRPMGEL